MSFRISDLVANGIVEGSTIKKTGGTGSQFLKADGTVDSSAYITSSALSGYATQSWVQSQGYLTAGSYLPLAGGTLTGPLRFNEGGYGRIAYADNYHGMIIRGYPYDSAGNVTVGDVTSLIQHSGDFRFYRTNGSINELYFQVNSSAAYWRGNTILHSGNYNSYSPTLTGGNASGTWGISISGTAAGETLATVTSRGASTASQLAFTKTDDHAISVGTIRGRAVGSQAGDYIMMYERVHIGYPSGWGAGAADAPSYGLGVWGNIHVSKSNATGGGIILADDGDIVDLNDAYCSMRFTSGVRIFSANRGGSAVITLGSNGVISAGNISTGVTASHIVQRDANGYIYANYINFNTSESENPTISSFLTSNGDGWSRKSSLAHVKNSIRGVADGTWGINITGNAGYASSAGNADTVDGYHMNQNVLTSSSPTFNNIYGSGEVAANGFRYQNGYATTYCGFGGGGLYNGYHIESSWGNLRHGDLTSYEVSADGSSWSAGSIDANIYNLFLGEKDKGGSLTIEASGVGRYKRFTFAIGYKNFDMLHITGSTNGESIYIKLEVSTDSGSNYTEHFTSIWSSWPGNHTKFWSIFNSSINRIRLTIYKPGNNYSNSASINSINYYGGYSGYNERYHMQVYNYDYQTANISRNTTVGGSLAVSGQIVAKQASSANADYANPLWIWANPDTDAIVIQNTTASGTPPKIYFRDTNGTIQTSNTLIRLRTSNSDSSSAYLSGGNWYATGSLTAGTSVTAGTRFQAPDMTIGYWDSTYNRIESGASRDLFITSYSGNIRFGHNGSVNMTFGSTRNLFINNPESYSGEVRLGAAWDRGGVYASNTLSLSTSSGNIDFVHSNSTTARLVGNTGNYGATLLMGTTSPSYTLIDGNYRPIVYLHGAYPALTLNHTATTNTNHGPTLQFVHNGEGARQWVIGTNGNGTRMDFGYSDSSYSNTNYNPHNGIAGYVGKTIMRMTTTGVIVGDCGTYPTINVPSQALHVNGKGYFSSNIMIYPQSESWAEGLSFTMPNTSTWGGLRWRRERAGNDGNWYIGFTALDSSDDLVFGANNGGTQVDNIIRLTKSGIVSAKYGYVSYSNPWGTSDSAYFPNGITTAGGTNWVYGFTYIGNAPSNGSGAQVESNGKFYFRNGSTSGSWGYAGLFVDRNNAANNYIPYSFEAEYGNHSWGIVARYHIQTGGQDKPSIQFTSTGSNDRWSLGFCTGSDWNFRITQNHGYRTDNSGNDGWGTERIRINTDGTNHLGLGSSQVYFARHIDARDTWGSCGCTTAFLGWYGSKIMLGNGNSGGHDYGNAKGGNTIISTNPHYFYSRIDANDVIRFQENDSRRIYGASLGSSYNAIRMAGEWNTFDVMGRVLDWTGSNLHFGNGYNGESHASYYVVVGNPVSYFKVEGPIYATGDVIAYYSDRRLKQNIQPINSALDIINKIGAYTFEWNKKSEEVWAKKEGDKDFGLISQEVEAVWPMGVAIQGGKDINDKYDYGNPDSEHYDPLHVEKNPDEYKTVRYDKMVTLAIAAIKEQQLLIDNQQKQIEEQQKQIELLNQKITHL